MRKNMADIKINEDFSENTIINNSQKKEDEKKTNLNITLYGQVTGMKSINGLDYFSVKNIVNNRFNYFDVIMPKRRPELTQIVQECYSTKETIRITGNINTKNIAKEKARISYIYPFSVQKSKYDRTDNVVKGSGYVHNINIIEKEDKHGRKNKIGYLVLSYKQGDRDAYVNLVLFGFINITRLQKLKINDYVSYEGFLKNRNQLHAGDMYAANDIYVSNWC